MPLSVDLEKAVDNAVDHERAALARLSHDIHANPELRFEEYKAAAWIAELLRARGFEVEQGVAGLPTALRASRGNKQGPRVAILGEYDALPEIGHACGHNLIAASAVGAFLSVRARTAAELARVRAIVERCAAGAALASGVKVEVVVREGYRDMRNNLALVRRFGAHLAASGRTAAETDSRVGAGSTDMGDVSHVVPAIHPYLAIVDENEALCHQHRFAAAAASDRGLETAYQAAKAMARTALELLTDAPLRAAVHEEWRAGA